MPGLRYLEGITTLELDPEKCTGCGMCVVVCPHAVFEIENARARIVDRDACIECGACALNCKPGAIKVDAGVGCAAAVILGKIRGTEPSCDCSGDPGTPCC
jgi:NAD-dependent dihydropyrimidine dehydrogenase PreA subunit